MNRFSCWRARSAVGRRWAFSQSLAAALLLWCLWTARWTHGQSPRPPAVGPPMTAGGHRPSGADPTAHVPDSAARNCFLKRFDVIAAQGFVSTQRSGATGVGYTLESLLQIPENNSPRGDFMGMEIKAHRLTDQKTSPHRKVNLFLKEPAWTDDLTTAERIRRFGYTRASGHPAWYQSVTCRVNDRGLRLHVNRAQQRVELQRRGRMIGHWSFAVLQQRLREKLREVVFVGAQVRGTGADEQFHYTSVTWCRGPSLDGFLSVLEQGDVIVELRMHVKASGGGRNHGTAFRIRPQRLGDLYAVRMPCRPLIKQPTTDGQ